MKVDIVTAAQRLKNAKDVLILTHRRPDGDTIGSGFGLHYGLKKLGIRSRIECSDPFPKKFDYICDKVIFEEFSPQFIVAVDTASPSLLGDLEEKYGDRIDLVIDHHKSNEFFAKETLLDVDSPATTELMTLLLAEMGIQLDIQIANPLFTGLVTDTGCFRFQSVTPRTHLVAARLIEAGAEHGEINRINFESITRGRLKVEAMARQTMEYYFEDRCALLYLPDDLEGKYGVAEEELDGITSLPRMIDGVLIGLTIRDQGNNEFRISVRSHSPYDSSRICSNFGGGGHLNAAGCTMIGELAEVKAELLKAVELEFRQEI